MASGKAIGEGPDGPKRKPRNDGSVKELAARVARTEKVIKDVASIVDEKIRLIWQELHDLRYGKQIEGDAGELEKKLKIK